jgi:hypothetical protein
VPSTKYALVSLSMLSLLTAPNVPFLAGGESGVGLYSLFLYLHCKQEAGICHLPNGATAYLVPQGGNETSLALLEDRLFAVITQPTHPPTF